MALTKSTYKGGRHGYAIMYHKPRTIVIHQYLGIRCQRSASTVEEAAMTEDDAENGAQTDEIPEGLFDDVEVEIHRAIIQREHTSGAFPDGDAVAAMEEPLHRLMGATVLFADICMLSSEDPPLSLMGLSFLANAMRRETLRLFRLYHGHPPRYLNY